jgi:hypothetical protein
MIIARDVKIVPRAAGEWDDTPSAITLFARHFFYDRTKKREKNNDKQQFCARCVKTLTFCTIVEKIN